MVEEDSEDRLVEEDMEEDHMVEEDSEDRLVEEDMEEDHMVEEDMEEDLVDLDHMEDQDLEDLVMVLIIMDLMMILFVAKFIKQLK